MTDWPNIRWTQARQIVALIDPAAANAVSDTLAPADYLATLKAEKRQEEAVTYLALALPRFDGVAWAADMLAAVPAKVGSPEAAAMAAVRAWIDRPDDQRRRAAWAAGEAAPDWSPERLLTHAVFLSGGSIAPPDVPAVQPAADLSGRMVAAAIVTAAHDGGSGGADTALARAIDAGEAAARRPSR